MKDTRSPGTNPALSTIHKLRYDLDKLDEAIRGADGTSYAATPEIDTILRNLRSILGATRDMIVGSGD